jgi:hypothetical protein
MSDTIIPRILWCSGQTTDGMRNGESRSSRELTIAVTLLVFLCLMVPLQSQPDRLSSVVRVGTQTESFYNPASTHNHEQHGVASKLSQEHITRILPRQHRRPFIFSHRPRHVCDIISLHQVFVDAQLHSQLTGAI